MPERKIKKWVTTEGYFRDIMVACMKPKADSLRLSCTYYKCVSRQVLQPGGGFGWQSPHKRLQHGPYTRSCLMGRSSVGRAAGLYPACRGFESFRPDLRGRAVRQLARFIPWRSQVQILPSLFASEEALFHENTCREMGAFLLARFDI